MFTGGNAVSSLRLDDTSIDAHAEYLGLFQKNSGTIRGLRLLSPQVDVSSSTLKGVGAVCGYSCGSLEGDSVDGADARVRAALTASNAEGIGGVAGVIEGNGLTITGLSASGAVTGTLPVSGDTARGIGGIAGSLTVSGTAVKNPHEPRFGNGQPLGRRHRRLSCGQRSADPSGSARLHERGSGPQQCGRGQDLARRTVHRQHRRLCLSCLARRLHQPGRPCGGLQYTQADRSRLRGRYVGGIVGYSNGSVLYRCSTGADGYVLGSEYVGGIVGGADEGANRLLLHDGTTRVTANAACVIGNSYVGGIIGAATAAALPSKTASIPALRQAIRRISAASAARTRKTRPSSTARATSRTPTARSTGASPAGARPAAIRAV